MRALLPLRIASLEGSSSQDRYLGSGRPAGAELDPAMPSHQALAGPGLHDPLHHGAAGHAEAAGSVVAVPAQLPTGHDLLLGRTGARPAEAEGHLPSQPHAGGECGTGEGLRPHPRERTKALSWPLLAREELILDPLQAPPLFRPKGLGIGILCW